MDSDPWNPRLHGLGNTPQHQRPALVGGLLGAGTWVPAASTMAARLTIQLCRTVEIVKPPAPIAILDRRFKGPRAGAQRWKQMALTLMSSVNAVVKP